MTRIAIPPGQEALLRSMLCDDCALPPGWRFEGAAVERTVVRARYRRGDMDAVVVLEHPSAARDPARRTARFALRLESGDDAAVLLDAVEASVRDHGDAWRWRAQDDAVGGAVDIELTALLAGAKPALRMTVDPRRVAEVVARYRGAGAAVAAFDGTARVRNRDVGLVYAARTDADARALRDVEAEFFALQARDVDDATSRGYHERIGGMLGYPTCCIDAFCGIGRTIDGIDDDYRAAGAAWTPRPRQRLNHLRRVEMLSLISFTPCSFECDAATAVANAIANAVGTANESALRHIDDHLARPLLVAANGLRANVTIDNGAITRASALSRTRGAAISPADTDLAAAFTGASPRDGAIEVAGIPAIVIDFS